MPEGPPPVAPIPPFVAAWILHRIPSRVWREAELGGMETNPAVARQLVQARVYLQHSAAWHRERLSSDSGTTELGLAEPVADSSCPPRISTAEAAEKLRVSRRYVVQLIDADVLRASRSPGRRAWQVDVESIEEYQMRNTE